MTRRSATVVTLISIGCSRQPTPAPSEVEPSLAVAPSPIATTPARKETSPPKAPEPLPPCTLDVSTLGLKGSTPEQLETRFGPPATREHFRAVERQGEFYGPLETLYPSIDPKNHAVPLQEWTWKSGACTLTVWFHRPGDEWLAIDDVYWHADIDF